MVLKSIFHSSGFISSAYKAHLLQGSLKRLLNIVANRNRTTCLTPISIFGGELSLKPNVFVIYVYIEKKNRNLFCCLQFNSKFDYVLVLMSCFTHLLYCFPFPVFLNCSSNCSNRVQPTGLLRNTFAEESVCHAQSENDGFSSRISEVT